jgi:DNA-binding MarR family transcriptional regulator
MQAAGLIERIRDPAVERQVFVELTERGKSFEDRAALKSNDGIGDRAEIQDKDHKR